MQYPLFNDPESYLKTRRGSGSLTIFKEMGEQRALDRILSNLHDIRVVCDAPCGAGTLFPYWYRKGFKIIGVDLSVSMVNLASKFFEGPDPDGYVIHGDIVTLPEVLRETPELVASVRFIYYFEKNRRIDFLRGFARTSNRYVLVQYKTWQTLRAGMNSVWKNGLLKRPLSKSFLSFRQIEEELRMAGLMNIRLVPISQFSDRVFAIGEKRLSRTYFS